MGEIGTRGARGLDRPAGGGGEEGGLVVGSGRTGGGCTGTSNSIGESEGLPAVPCVFFLLFSLDETTGIKRNRVAAKQCSVQVCLWVGEKRDEYGGEAGRDG